MYNFLGRKTSIFNENTAITGIILCFRHISMYGIFDNYRITGNTLDYIQVSKNEIPALALVKNVYRKTWPISEENNIYLFTNNNIMQFFTHILRLYMYTV